MRRLLQESYERSGQAALCWALGLPHGDDPGCVAAAVRSCKIALNDGPWSSPIARAKGMRDLGLAQLGSLGVVADVEFSAKLAEATIRRLLPALFRNLLKNFPDCLAAANRCEREGTVEAAGTAAGVAARAAGEAARVAEWAAEWAAASAAREAEAAAGDKYLLLFAAIVLGILREMGSPGCALLPLREK